MPLRIEEWRKADRRNIFGRINQIATYRVSYVAGWLKKP